MGIETQIPQARQAKQTFFSIQILRGIAALCVVACHAGVEFPVYELKTALGRLAFGVDIFFVISGVVIGFTARKLSYGQFIERRLIRIVPLYWAFLTAKLVVLLFANVSARKLNLSPGYVLQSYFFIPAYDGDGQALPLIVAGWTLNFEMYFYLLCTLAMMLSVRRFSLIASTIVAAGALAGILILSNVSPSTPAVAYILSPIALEFVAGLYLVRLYQRGVRLPAWASWLIIGIATVWLVALAPSNLTYYTPSRVLTWGLGAIGIVWGALNLEDRLPLHKARLSLLMGDASYSLYLSHTALLPVLAPLLRRVGLHGVMAILAFVLIASVVGVIVHKFLERPLLKAIAQRVHVGKFLLGGRAV